MFHLSTLSADSIEINQIYVNQLLFYCSYLLPKLRLTSTPCSVIACRSRLTLPMNVDTFLLIGSRCAFWQVPDVRWWPTGRVTRAHLLWMLRPGIKCPQGHLATDYFQKATGVLPGPRPCLLPRRLVTMVLWTQEETLGIITHHVSLMIYNKAHRK